MDSAEKMDKFPKLDASERAGLLRRLREREVKDAMRFLHESADLMFEELEQQSHD
jgi:hypothetical protein